MVPGHGPPGTDPERAHGGVAGGRLASAVSDAGGLGMIGVGSAGSVDHLEREAAHPQRAGLPFGIGLLGWAVHGEPRLLDAAIDAAPVLVRELWRDLVLGRARPCCGNRDGCPGLLGGVGDLRPGGRNRCVGGEGARRRRPR